MPEQTTTSELRLLALSRYIGALEQGEIEPLIEVLNEAEHDLLLAQLLQEVDTLYQELDQTAVSELQGRRALQTVLASRQPRRVRQKSQGVREQSSQLHEIRIQHGNREIIMEDQTIMPMSLEPDAGPPTRRPHKRWLHTLAAILAICMLLAATPILLNLRQQTGGSHYTQQTPIATASPQVAQNNYKALASRYVSHMSLDDEIGQLMMVEYSSTTYSSDLDYMINTLHVGGVIMYALQMTSLNQTKGDIAHMQQRANIPLLISTDQEGGLVDRLHQIYGPSMSATDIENTGNPSLAGQQGLKTSQELKTLGINVNLAPDVDVNQVNGYDMVTRTFGNTPDQVIKYAGAYLQTMQGNGTIACIKHFPGLGGATTDAHSALPVVNSSQQDIYNIDLAPFKTFIQSPNALLNPGMIMSADVMMPTIDAKYPAELSRAFITDILRNQFHYDGVVLTDALYMQGISATWNLNTAAILALQAGDDMLLGANGTQQASAMISAIKQAVQDGQLTKARIDESVTRIIALKMQYHLIPTNIPGA